jgi:hypothetical protein
MMPVPNAILGYFVEGVVEQDPLDNHYLIRTSDPDGNPVNFDVRDALAKMVGKEVRFTLNSFENLSELAHLLEERGQEMGPLVEDIPGTSGR